jgi:hypothetical protein
MTEKNVREMMRKAYRVTANEKLTAVIEAVLHDNNSVSPTKTLAQKIAVDVQLHYFRHNIDSEVFGYTTGLEDAAALYESVSPASDDERLKGHPGAGAMGAVIEYRDKIRALMAPSPTATEEIQESAAAPSHTSPSETPRTSASPTSPTGEP